MPVHVEVDGPVLIVTIDRPEVRNAVDRPTADALLEAFERFDDDPARRVAVLTGAGGTFCAGADLQAVGDDPERTNRLERSSRGPMGPSRLELGKPVIAAVEGHAVAGGLELALWADLRVVANDAVLGVFCRRLGVPLIDGGTVRLPRLIGQARAMDLILTGRAVDAEEAFEIGLATRLTSHGSALAAAVALAHRLAALPCGPGTARGSRRVRGRGSHRGGSTPRDESATRIQGPDPGGRALAESPWAKRFT